MAPGKLDLFAQDSGPQASAPAPAATVPELQLPPGARWREIVIEGELVRFVLQRSRRRTIGFLIGDDGLRVTAPRWVGLGEIDDAVRSKARWILAKPHDWRQRKERLALHQTRWEDGGDSDRHQVTSCAFPPRGDPILIHWVHFSSLDSASRDLTRYAATSREPSRFLRRRLSASCYCCPV